MYTFPLKFNAWSAACCFHWCCCTPDCLFIIYSTSQLILDKVLRLGFLNSILDAVLTKSLKILRSNLLVNTLLILHEVLNSKLNLNTLLSIKSACYFSFLSYVFRTVLLHHILIALHVAVTFLTVLFFCFVYIVYYILWRLFHISYSYSEHTRTQILSQF